MVSELKRRRSEIDRLKQGIKVGERERKLLLQQQRRLLPPPPSSSEPEVDTTRDGGGGDDGADESESRDGRTRRRWQSSGCREESLSFMMRGNFSGNSLTTTGTYLFYKNSLPSSSA